MNLPPKDDYRELMHTIDRVETEPARWLSNRLWHLFHPNRVIDWGCANGEYLVPFLEHGCQIQGVDGEPTAGSKIPNNFYCADLRQPQTCGGKFDLAICLEVAEHLQAEYADQLVANVANSADLVFWSAARPGQGGYMHHNEQPMEYWLNKFDRHGFTLHPLNDLVCQEIADNPLSKTVDWLISNVRVLERKPKGNYLHNWGGDTLPLKWLPFIADRIGDPMIYIEIGSFEGLSATTTLRYYLTHPDSRLICIDPFGRNPGFMGGIEMGDYGGRFLENILPYRGKVIVLPMYSVQAATELARILKKNSVDIALIDGNHDGNVPFLDAEMCYPYINKGGIVVFDDVQWEDPRQSCEKFADRHKLEIFKVPDSSQWIVRKK